MKDLIVHKVNISHYRLVELAKLANQAKPFYDWIEKHAKRLSGSHKNLGEILLEAKRPLIRKIIETCYNDPNDEKPFLFDGIGRVYPHGKACFYFFAWIIRDAPQQRLAPLISRMQKEDAVTKPTAELDTLAGLIFEYKALVRTFEWAAIREIVIDRLEGSRRSISGHNLEAQVRTALVTAFQNYYAIYNNYGNFRRVEIANKQIKIGDHTVDVSANLTSKADGKVLPILIPVKTRETEGGGHSHIFSRDIVAAITDIKKELPNYRIIVVIIAENWSAREITSITDQIDAIFHFNMSPNKFTGFDDSAQIKLNKLVEKVLGTK